MELLGQQNPDIVIAGEGFAMVEAAVKQRGIPLLLLREDAPRRIAEETDYLKEPGASCAEVFRYQPMEGILHEMWVLTGGKAREALPGTAVLGGLEVIGVYSPMRHEMQLPFSIVLSEILSEKRKVLYVNLMEYSGFYELFGLTEGYDLGDIFLRLRNGRLSPETFRRSVYGTDRMGYIPPFANPEDLREISHTDCISFVDFLKKETDFETVVLDFGIGVANFAGILQRCSSVYCPVKNGYFYDCQLHDFMDYLNRQSAGQLAERLHVIPLPFSGKQIHGGGDIRQQLLWSEFGDYVRDFLTGCIV